MGVPYSSIPQSTEVSFVVVCYVSFEFSSLWAPIPASFLQETLPRSKPSLSLFRSPKAQNHSFARVQKSDILNFERSAHN